MQNCFQVENSSNARCARCGAVKPQMHRAGPLFRRRIYCPACCVACHPQPAAVVPARAKRQTFQWDGYGPPRGPDGSYLNPEDDAFYRDEQRRQWVNDHSPRATPRWIPRRDWFRRRR